MALSTLRSWMGQWATRQLTACPRGRPSRSRSRQQRRAVLEQIRAHPSLGARRIARQTDVPKRVVAALKARVKEMLDRRRCRYRCVWTRPGSVWAMDYTEPSVRQEAGATRVLVVRDLASGQQLSSLSMKAESGEAVAAELDQLFTRHGAPLVLKSDNGAPLIAGPVRAVMAARGVTLLRSPPYTPQFNGSCERGLGWLKVHAEEYMHARAGSALSQQDLDSSRELQNRSGSPRHGRGLSPQRAWDSRLRVARQERTDFRQACDEARAAAPKPEGKGALLRRERAKIERTAISRVLCNLHYLKIRRA